MGQTDGESLDQGHAAKGRQDGRYAEIADDSPEGGRVVSGVGWARFERLGPVVLRRALKARRRAAKRRAIFGAPLVLNAAYGLVRVNLHKSGSKLLTTKGLLQGGD